MLMPFTEMRKLGKYSRKKFETPIRHLTENVKRAFECMDLVFRGRDKLECHQLLYDI